MPTGRVLGLDVARCLALVGMVAVHVLPDDSTVHDLCRGRAAALFAVLAGVTLALLSGRTEPVRGADRVAASAGLAARALAIALLGMTLGLLDSGLAVILTYLGLLLLLGLLFLGLRARPLVALAAGWAVLAPVVSHVLRERLPEPTYAVPSFDRLDEPGRMLAELMVTGYYPALTWLAYLLLGLAVGRSDLRDRVTATRLVVAGLAAAAAAFVASLWWAYPELVAAAGDGLYGVTPTDDWAWLLVVTPHSGTPFDLVHTGGVAVAVVGLCLLLTAPLRETAARVVAVVFGAGTMTLTLYSLHVVLRTELVWPPDADSPDAFAWHALVLLWAGALSVALHRRGPLEQLVRAVSKAVSSTARRVSRG